MVWWCGVYRLNKQFLKDLEGRLKDWVDKETRDQCFGDLFVRFGPYFKMYSMYCNNYEAGSKLLEQLQHKKNEKKYDKFQQFCAETTKDKRVRGQQLASFLIMPIQRIPRYKLLLDELLKRTEATHPDHEIISKALVGVGAVATHINEAVRQRENRDAILKLQDMFKENPQFVSPSRSFVRKGTLLKKCRAADKRYEFFLL